CCRSGGAPVSFQWKLLLISLQYLQGRQGTLSTWTQQTAEDASSCYTCRGFVLIFNLQDKLLFKCKPKSH
ncbi:hypothetical protein N302_04696, partial [Corvus brachyrhynchos]